jgi:hypothetical protein
MAENKQMMAAAAMLVDSARTLEYVAEKFESIMDQQASVLDRLSDTLDSMGKEGKGGLGGAKQFGSGIKEMAGGLGELSKVLPELIKGLVGFNKAKAGSELFVNFVNNFSKSIGEAIKVGGDSIKTQYEEFALAFTSISQGIAKLSWGLYMFDKLTTEEGTKRFTDFVTDFFKKFSEFDGKKSKENAEAFSIMSSSIATFGLVIALSTPLYVIGAVGSLIIIPMLALYAYTFGKIGEASEEIREGGRAVAWMGLGIAGFALALFVTKQLSGGSWKDYAEGALIVATGLILFSMLFKFLGDESESIGEGGKAVAWMGLALIALAFGIASFQLLQIDIKSVLIAGAAILVTGLAMGVVGVFAEYIEKGAFAIAVGGLSLIVLALGLGAFRLFKITADDYMMAGAAIVAVSGAMALAGLAAIPIFFGAAALILASVALITLAAGLTVIGAVYNKAADGILAKPADGGYSTNLELIINGVASAFSINVADSAMMFVGATALIFASIAMVTLTVGLFAMEAVYKLAKNGILATDKATGYPTNLNMIINGVASAFAINPIDSVLMIAGAAGLIIASVAMVTLSGGLLVFNLMYKKSQELFSPSDQDPSRSKLTYALDSIIDGFVMNPLRLAGFYLSIPAWLMAGFALMSIGAGIAKFVDFVQKKIDVNKIGDMIKTVLTSVTDVFTGVSKGGDLVDWDSVEDGIDAVSGIGNIISGIADGVAKMADLKFPIYGKDGKITGYYGIGDKQFAQVSTNMKLIINAVAGTLTEIGKSQGETGWFSKTDGEKGADVIRGIGGDLVGLADFVQKAANLTFPIYDKDGKQIGVTTLNPAQLGDGGSVRKNIISMIQAVTGALAAVGSGEAAKSGWFNDSDIEKGKAAIQGIAGDLNGIATMVQTVAGIQDFSQVSTRIKSILMVIPQAFLDASKIIEPNKATLYSVSGVIKTLAGPLESLTDLIMKADEKKISGAGISKSISSVMSAVASIKPNDSFGAVVGFLERMAATADPMTKLANSFEKIAKSMDKFAGTFKKMSPSAVKTSDMLIQSLVTFAKVDPNAFNTLTDKGKALINFIYEKGAESKAPEAATPPAPSLAKTAEPGKKPLAPAAPVTPAGPSKESLQMTQLMTDLSTNMSSMAGALKDIKMILQGTLKVQTI